MKFNFLWHADFQYMEAMKKEVEVEMRTVMMKEVYEKRKETARELK